MKQIHEEADEVRSKGDEEYRCKRRIELYLLAAKTWKEFNLTCKDYCNWTISHVQLFDDFRQSVYDAIYVRGKENLNDLRDLTTVHDLFSRGHYFEGCKKLKVL